MRIVYRAPNSSLRGRVYDDTEAWEILRSLKHVSKDPHRREIVLECRVTGNRMTFKGDDDAFSVHPSSFYAIVYGIDEHDVFTFAYRYLGRQISWAERVSILQSCIEQSNLITPETRDAVLAYCIMAATEQARCPECNKVRHLDHIEYMSLIKSEVIPDGRCPKCRSKKEKEEAAGAMAQGVPREEIGNDDEPDGHRGNDGKTGD